MTWMYEQLEGKAKLEWALSELRHEEHVGVHTYHSCKCGRKLCRTNWCTLCWKEEIKRLKVRGKTP